MRQKIEILLADGVSADEAEKIGRALLNCTDKVDNMTRIGFYPENVKIDRELYKSTSMGSSGSFALEIKVGGTLVPADLDSGEIRDAYYDAAKKITFAVCKAGKQNDEKAQEDAKKIRADLLACFPDSIYVEEIPNGYCSDWCCAHLPWFIVSTSIGRFKIGWRKRVINIDWTDTLCKKSGEEVLGDDEQVTRLERGTHAYGYAKAKEYIDKVFAYVASKGVENES